MRGESETQVQSGGSFIMPALDLAAESLKLRFRVGGSFIMPALDLAAESLKLRFRVGGPSSCRP